MYSRTFSFLSGTAPQSTSRNHRCCLTSSAPFCKKEQPSSAQRRPAGRESTEHRQALEDSTQRETRVLHESSLCPQRKPPMTACERHYMLLVTIERNAIMELRLPWWLRGKRTCRQGRTYGFHPWAGTICWRRKWQSNPVFLPGESHGQRSLVGYTPWGCRESDTTQ